MHSLHNFDVLITIVTFLLFIFNISSTGQDILKPLNCINMLISKDTTLKVLCQS